MLTRIIAHHSTGSIYRSKIFNLLFVWCCMNNDEITSQRSIENAITKYLKEPDTDYGIMINGSWGSGKTYYVKHNIEALVKSLNKKFVYVSLYGVAQQSEIDKKILISLNPMLGKNVTKVMIGILKWLARREDVDIIIKDYEIPLDNHVIVFDDFERISENRYNELLGCLNSYAEHRKAKILILCDESKIVDNKYKEIKEKTIRYTYKYHLNQGEFYQAAIKISENLDSRVADVVKRNGAFIKSLSYNKNDNLRTLCQALSNLKYIMDSVEKQRYLDAYSNTMLRVFVGYLFHINSGSTGVEEISNLVNGKLSSFEMAYIKAYKQNQTSTLQEAELEAEAAFGLSFHKQYFDDETAYYVSDVAMAICIDGYSEKQAMIDDYNKYVSETHPEKSIRHMLIQDVWTLSSDELQEAINDSIRDLRSFSFNSATSMLREVRSIDYCIHEKLYNGITRQELEFLAKENITRMAANNPELLVAEVENPSQPLAFAIEFTHYHTLVDSIVIALANYAIILAKSEGNKLHKQKINGLWLEFTSSHSKDAYFELLKPDSQYATQPFFSEIRPHIIKDSVYQITAKDCFALRDALSNRYNNLANFPAIAEDYYILDVLSKEIDVALSKYNNGDIWTPQHAALGHLNEWLKASLPILEAVLDK